MYADVLLFAMGMPVSLAGSQASGDSSVSPSHLPARALALWMHTAASSCYPSPENPNLGPHIYTVSALPVELGPTLCFSLHAFQLVVNGLGIQHDH